jgi:hypothetical protein
MDKTKEKRRRGKVNNSNARNDTISARDRQKHSWRVVKKLDVLLSVSSLGMR